MIYGSETMPFLANAGLMFERADMIRWMCGISMKTERPVKIENAGWS